MYIPKAFEVTDKKVLLKFIKENSFATVISSNQDGQLIGSHLPILYDEKKDCLIGHMAKANDQWTNTDSQILIIFHGPHAYISPTWYKENNTVPTWNYVTVHASGTLKVINESDRARSIISTTVDHYERSFDNPWSFTFNDEFISKLMDMIVCFEVYVSRWEGKWKLNQNHSVTRRRNLVEGLLTTNDFNSIKIAELMKRNI